MKKLIVVIALMTFYSTAFCQNLTLSQILSIRKKNIGEAEEYLTQKGWKFFGAQEPKDGYMGSLDFAYNIGDYDDKAESFITLFYSHVPGNYNRILVQISIKEKYNEYIRQIKSLGGKMINSYVKDKEFYKIYQGSTLTYIVSTFNQSDIMNVKKNVYSILIITNKDYQYFPFNKK